MLNSNYSDEDYIDSFDRRYKPYFKPDYNYELLLTHNFIGSLAIFDIAVIKSIYSSVKEITPINQSDIILRVIETINAQQIKHISSGSLP